MTPAMHQHKLKCKGQLLNCVTIWKTSQKTTDIVEFCLVITVIKPGQVTSLLAMQP